MTKEPNATKLFIGQIPHEWGEKELTELFEPYGEIYRMNLLQDKASGEHKGCAFLVYYDNESAKKAQAEVHESRTLPGARHPIQVKPAASEGNVEDRTLYVGMLSKKLDEGGVRDMFSRFGTIEYLHILRNPDGRSKGCAFLKFENRLQAQNAIKRMHNSETMEGCTYPLVVKIADTDKDKLAKKGANQAGSSVLSPSSYRIAPVGVSPHPASAYYQQIVAQQMALPSLVAGSPAVIAAPIIQGSVQHSLQQPQYQVIGQPVQAGKRSQLTTLSQASQNLLTGSPAGVMSTLPVLGVGGLGNYVAYSANGSSLSDATLQPSYSGIQPYIQAYSVPKQTEYQTRPGKKSSSDDTNLFIYHLPPDFNDSDLLQTFMPFGTVVSAKVYIDKATGLSKCFGFVNYSNSSSASAAIRAMNGATIGSKRLKVQLKRPKDKDKPY